MENVTLDPLTLADLDTARWYLKAESTSFDPLIMALINYASAQIEMYCRRRLLARDYDTDALTVGKQPTELRDGHGDNELMLKEYPVNSVAGIVDRYPDGVNTRTVNITGLRIIGDSIISIPADSFTRGSRNIEVRYNAGYTVANHMRERRALEAACLRWVQVMYQDHDAVVGRGTSFGVGGETVQLISEPIPPDIRQALAPFVRLV
jgi:hypothetical protein